MGRMWQELNVQKNANSGPRRGEDHPRAELTNREVELMRALYAAGGWGYGRLAAKFECSKASVRDIVKERRRVYG